MGGRATGADREYQGSCLEFLRKRDRGLRPFEGDGIDVLINGVVGTSVTFDAVLRLPSGAVVVAECKRWKSPVKQANFFAFAKQVEGLRNALKSEVAGVFFACSGVQEGGLKVAADVGIEVIEIDPMKSSSSSEVFKYLRYDKERERRIEDAIATLTENIGVQDNVVLRLREAD